MNKEYELVYIHRGKDGKYLRQIKLGERFISEMNEMREMIFRTWEANIDLCLQIYALNEKLNTIFIDKVFYNMKGIDFCKWGEYPNELTRTSISKVMENINVFLYCIIYDCEHNMLGCMPQVLHDHIIFFMTVYRELKSNKWIKEILSEEQIKIIDGRFCKCMELFNNMIDSIITSNTISFLGSMIARLLFSESFQPSLYFINNNELERYKLDFVSNEQPIKSFQLE